ncbi:MAG: TonB-dependent receptor [Gemmatimonadota bacterium]
MASAIAYATAILAAFALPITSLSAQTTARADSARADSARALERVIVNAIRGGDRAPVAQKTLDRRTITERNFGQDAPMLLQGASPSVISHTETGTPVGYSYVRLRGIDQTRLNITLDGIPLNDMEDQVLYFANLADLMSSVSSVQIQRGVGTSTNGTASYAGSLNLETSPIMNSNRGVEAQLQGGSFSQQRASVSFRSGLLPNRFAVSGRASAQRIDGYRYNAGAEQRSAFVTAGWFGDRDIVKVTALAGLLRDTLAYNGVTREELAGDRRINPLTPEDRDRFGQQLFALSYTRAFGVTQSLSTTVYRNSTGGSYDYYSEPDVYNYGLDYTWYGVTSAFHTQNGALRTDVGVNANSYARRHRSFLGREQAVTYYDNTGHKRDASAFVKLSYEAGRARWFGDLQTRNAEFRYEPDANAGISERSVNWTFVNPKVGVTVALARGWSAFASVGQTTREPARADMLAGADNMDTTNVGEIGNLARVRPETVRDVEAGVTLVRDRGELSANVYAMSFRNNIAPIGLPTASGAPLRRNVGSTYRRGVELDGTWRPTARLELGANATLSTNRIRAYTDSSLAVPVSYRDVEPLLSPSVLTAQRARFTVGRVALSLEGRYQGEAALDNTGSETLRLPDYYVLDAGARVQIGRHALVVRGINLGDSQRFGSGYASEGVPYFFVLPPRSVFVTAELVF